MENYGWLLLSILAAFAQASRNLFMKDLGHKLDEYINVWGRFTFLLPFTFLINWYVGFPEIQPGFWLNSLAAASSVTIATLLLSKAFKYGHISEATAIWKIGIVIFLILGVIFLDEQPSLLGIIGIFIVLIGVYLLNISKAHVSWFQPIKLLFTDRGMRYALLAAITVAPAMMFFKTTSQLSNGYFSGMVNYALASVMMFPLVLKESRQHFKIIPQHLGAFLGMGLAAAVTTIASNIAYVQTVGAYVEGIKQIEIIFVFIFGALFFQEAQRIKEIWLGSSVIVGGMLLIIFS